MDPFNAAWSVLKTDMQLGRQPDPDDPHNYHLDLTERGLASSREHPFVDNFKSDAEHEQRMHEDYGIDDGEEDFLPYSEPPRSAQEMREEAMSELDGLDRHSAGRVIDRLKDADINNAMLAAHYEGGFQNAEGQGKEILAHIRQQMEPDPREHVSNVRPAPFFTREGFYGPGDLAPRRQMSALPLGPNTELKSYNIRLPQTNMASPLEHAWYVLKAPRQRDATPISMAGGNAPVRSHDDMGMGSSPGGRRASENNAIKREMLRQRKDAQEGETRDPFAADEEEMSQVQRDKGPLSPELSKPDPVSPEFIQQLMAEGGSFGLPPSLQRYMATKDMG